jgi:uncharacterized protein (DUF169 family)
MTQVDFQTTADLLRDTLRLKTPPVSVSFLDGPEAFDAKTRRPSGDLGRRITFCQAVTMARLYGWSVGLTRKDIICVPAMLAFGFSGASSPADRLGNLFCEVDFARSAENGVAEVETMYRLNNGEYPAILVKPLGRGDVLPNVVAIYANPAQIMRMVQAIVYVTGVRIVGNFGGKVECTEYLLAPFRTREPRVAIPGMGDRIFSMTQDDEMVLSLPVEGLSALVSGLENAGRSIGARYPVTHYQAFEPVFPPAYGRLADELGLFADKD